VLTRIDVGPPDATCRHEAVVPTGGFTVPTFCIPALGFTSDILPSGCTGGTADGRGSVWDAAAACADADVSKVGDTRDGTCDAETGACPGVGPANAIGNVNATRGDGSCDPPGVQTQLDIPGTSLTWSDGDGTPNCPDEDSVFDPGTDSVVSQFTFILSPTSATATARFADQNGDGCFRQGGGPNGPITLTGSPSAGPCCVVGQATTVVAAGLAFSGGAPLFDLLFRSTTPSTITECNPGGALGSCTLDTQGGCLD
jgi:hypothetical protein